MDASCSSASNCGIITYYKFNKMKETLVVVDFQYDFCLLGAPLYVPGSDKAEEIQEYCRGRIRCAFGIGTNLTNDTGFKPSNIVMKLTSCRMNKNQPVFNCVKLSDDLGKHTGDTEEVKHCIQTISKF